MPRVLVVDDEPAVSDVVEFALVQAGFEVRTAGSLRAARRALDEQTVDLLILDLGLPDGDGLDFCRELRAVERLPILMLTCRDHEVDRILGLESGADDYVVKPFSPRELAARVRSILRRSGDPGPAPARTLRRGPITLDADEHRVRLHDRLIPLTPREFELLRALLESPSRAFTRQQLVDRVHGDGAYVSDRTIDSHVKGIRRKFAEADREADPIETVYGIGYRARDVS
jgi:DNA-binding response OmpR family regulator